MCLQGDLEQVANDLGELSNLQEVVLVKPPPVYVPTGENDTAPEGEWEHLESYRNHTVKVMCLLYCRALKHPSFCSPWPRTDDNAWRCVWNVQIWCSAGMVWGEQVEKQQAGVHSRQIGNPSGMPSFAEPKTWQSQNLPRAAPFHLAQTPSRCRLCSSSLAPATLCLMTTSLRSSWR